MITADCMRLGDCLEVLKELQPKSMDMVLVDPPYGTTRCKWDAIIPLEPMWEQINRVAKDDAAIVIMAAQPFTSVLINSNLNNFKYCWVWDKMVGRGHLVAKKRPMARHEDICVFYRKAPNYFPIMTPKEKPTKGKEGKRTSIMGGKSSGYSATYTHSYPQTIISIPSEGNAGKVHPTQKPVELMEYLIKTYTNEGEWVLDFAMGSGTTGVACANTNRNFIGIEKDETYFTNAVARVLAAANK